MQILCFGDSNTYGFDPRIGLGGRLPSEARWVDILAQNTGWKIRNRGENGREIPTPAAACPVQRMLQANRATDLLIVMLGTNDLLHGASILETADRMERFLQEILPFCKQILLIAPPPMKEGEWVHGKELITRSEQLAETYRALANRLQIGFCDAALWEPAYFSDGVHLNADGNLAFAKGLQEFLLSDRSPIAQCGFGE